MAQSGKWLTVAAVVARLRDAGFDDSIRTVQRMADRGEIRAFRTGGRQRRIEPASVDELIRRRRDEVATDTGSAAAPEPAPEAVGDEAAPPDAGEREPTQPG